MTHMESTQNVEEQKRIPDQLNVGSSINDDLPAKNLLEAPQHTMMHVPNRIVVAGDDDEPWFNSHRDLDPTQAIAIEPIQLKAPPRVLTLDFTVPLQPAASSAQLTEEESSHSHLRRRRCTSESSAVRHYNQINNSDAGVSSSTASPSGPVRVCPPLVSPVDSESVYSVGGVLSYVQCATRRSYQQVLSMLGEGHSRMALTTVDVNLEVTPSDVSTADAAGLRRQIMKLNRRLVMLEEANKQRSRRQMFFYSLTVAFWLIKTWIWLRR